MYDIVQGWASSVANEIEAEIGKFIVLWFIVGGLLTFFVVVATYSQNWPGVVYALLWIALGALFTPVLFRD